jgi:hypothetical protein
MSGPCFHSAKSISRRTTSDPLSADLETLSVFTPAVRPRTAAETPYPRKPGRAGLFPGKPPSEAATMRVSELMLPCTSPRAGLTTRVVYDRFCLSKFRD